MSSRPSRRLSSTSTILFTLAGRMRRADLPVLCERVLALLEGSDADVAVCDVAELAPDAAAIDALARSHLLARRLGGELRLSRASSELRDLLDFAGLVEVLRLEPGGQAEEREQRLRVEEERELDDPAV